MKDRNCEDILIAKMAELDGEAEISADVEAHFRSCQSCRGEIENLRRIDGVFEQYSRAEVPVSVWPSVSESITVQDPPFHAKAFAFLAAGLVVFKVLQLSVENDPGMLFGIVPLVVAGALFLLIRENPFRINPNILLEN